MTARRVPPERQARVCACGDHGFVPLTRGKVALIDAADIPLVWHRRWTAKVTTGGFYAATVSQYMHRAILGTPSGSHTDHRNHDTLDNRRGNLRICTPAQNVHNRRATKGFKGVYLFKGRWCAKICLDKRQRFLGAFDTAEDAARAYDAAALTLHRDFACTNAMLGLLPQSPARGVA